ncbi:hypothetical protein [Roseovarius gahaiensis]|uniref:hypothetical protein n=1 Tax=Roseovarius gahaiensis TaxID=2716691 RepID=UPI001E38E301|nr:hypothetical protein [Roseovarius gahaiensis]
MSIDRDLNAGPVSRALISVSAPMTLGILGVLSVGLADAFFWRAIVIRRWLPSGLSIR